MEDVTGGVNDYCYCERRRLLVSVPEASSGVGMRISCGWLRLLVGREKEKC